ncbi:MAG: amidophosphoribosyltransferase, partial [Methylophaga sp.]|nr:amidophosphoribosyltransferase [Methylophaga sp.]
EVGTAIGADKMIYQDLEDLIQAVQKGNTKISHFDTSCFDHQYITGDIDDTYLQNIEALRNDTAQTENNTGSSIIDMHNSN